MFREYSIKSFEDCHLPEDPLIQSIGKPNHSYLDFSKDLKTGIQTSARHASIATGYSETVRKWKKSRSPSEESLMEK